MIAGCTPKIIKSHCLQWLNPFLLTNFELNSTKCFSSICWTKYDDSVIEPNTQEYISKYHIDGYKDNENIFEFICNVGK